MKKIGFLLLAVFLTGVTVNTSTKETIRYICGSILQS